MKRIIREAAEKGYDKVAWTPGSVQAARYDLSKHIVKARLQSRERQIYGGYATRAARQLSIPDVRTDKLADYVGKDAADKD